MPSFKESERGLTSMLPASVDDSVPEDHLACFIVDIVDRLDLTVLAGGDSGRGKAADHPSVMVALLFHSHASGVFTSRRGEAACRDRLSCRPVTGTLVPDHDTRASFRQRGGPLLDGIFLQILQRARGAGLLRLGRVSLDGTRIRADASRHKALSHAQAERLARQLRAEVATLMRPAAAREAEEEGSPAGADAVARMRHRMGTSEGKAIYAKRKATVATVFGVIKETLGFRQFSRRGQAAGCEWRLVCTAWNLKRLHALSLSAAAG